MTIIQLSNLKKEYKKRTIFRNVNLNISSHGMICIKGKSGIGKSTLLNILAGLELSNSGSYHFENTLMSTKSVNELARIRGDKIGYISQFSPMIPNLTAFENVCVPLWFNSGEKNKEEQIKRINYLSELFGVKSLLKTKIGELSGGEIQRIGIIRALINQLKLIIADEPTGALDDETTMKILDLFNVLKKKAL